LDQTPFQVICFRGAGLTAIRRRQRVGGSQMVVFVGLNICASRVTSSLLVVRRLKVRLDGRSSHCIQTSVKKSVNAKPKADVRFHLAYLSLSCCALFLLYYVRPCMFSDHRFSLYAFKSE